MKHLLFSTLVGAFLSVSAVHATEAMSSADFTTLEQWTALQSQQVTTEATTADANVFTKVSNYYYGYCYWRCYARNRYGDVYYADSNDQWSAQNGAMNACFYYSRSCRPLGCNQTW